MKTLRHGALLALLLGSALALRAADRVGPEAGEIIHPRLSAAADAGAAVTEGVPASPSLTGFFPAGGYLVVLVILLGGAWYLLKRGHLPRPFAKNDGRLRVLETRLLGNRQFLVVVEYDEAKMLLGVCPGRIDYLTPLAGHPLAAPVGTADEDETEPPLAAVAAGSRR